MASNTSVEFYLDLPIDELFEWYDTYSDINEQLDRQVNKNV